MADWQDKVCGTGFVSHCNGLDGYEIHFSTDDENMYRFVEATCRICVDVKNVEDDMIKAIVRRAADNG